ncbi:MAG: hypothetical protein JJ855_16155 [Rhodospirillales bacterium]|nr:hypothetical protein [Rhodospirillales bacterium]
MEKYKCLAAVLSLTIVAGCAVVEKDGDHIAIRHSSENNLFVQHEADEHCAYFGKKAVKVQESDPMASILFLRSRVSTFKCVHESELPKDADGKKPAS